MLKSRQETPRDQSRRTWLRWLASLPVVGTVASLPAINAVGHPAVSPSGVGLPKVLRELPKGAIAAITIRADTGLETFLVLQTPWRTHRAAMEDLERGLANVRRAVERGIVVRPDRYPSDDD